MQNTREEKFKVLGKYDVFHISECAKRNEHEYRQREVPFHGAADSTSRAKYRSQHNHQTTGWTKQESWVDSWQQQELFLPLKHPDRLWNPPILLLNAFPALFPRSKVAGA